MGDWKLIFNGSDKFFTKKDRALFDLVHAFSADHSVGESEYFVKYPLFRMENGVSVVSQGMLACQGVGVIIFAVSDATKYNTSGVKESKNELESVYSYLTSKLFRNPSLRKRSSLKFNVVSIIYAPNLEDDDLAHDEDGDFCVVRNLSGLMNILSEIILQEKLSNQLYEDLVGTIDGARSLVPVEKTQVPDGKENKKIGIVATIESSIRDFDNDQKKGYLSPVVGLQRIRGLAGSGKTVILAHKVALLHAENPDATILYTYYTKSLRQLVIKLIGRFFAEYSDRKPDWKKIRVMHAWGGQSIPGFYYEYCKFMGVSPMSYRDAQYMATGNMSPFEYACSELLKSGPRPFFDYVFLDEAQDFGSNFIKLAFSSVHQQRLVIGLDVFQTIFQINAPAVRETLGVDVELTEDVVLKTCYRTPRSILVCAHAMGLGVYKRPVQILESIDHWRDIGYEHISGELLPKSRVVFERPRSFAPLMADEDVESLISVGSFTDLQSEVTDLVQRIACDIKEEGLKPEDVVVICADDYNCRAYFAEITNKLSELSIFVNNTQVDSNSVAGFSVNGRVTLSTLHKAKGNEAYSVYVVGIDAIYSGTATTVTNRNRIFTVMTRTKGWLSISGIGDAAKEFSEELRYAMSLAPRLDFEYPSPEDVRRLQRDLKLVPQAEKDEALKAIIAKYGVEFVKEFLSSVKDPKGKL